MIRLVGATNVTIQGLNVSGSTGAGLSVIGSTNILIDSFKDEYLYDLKEDLDLKSLKQTNPYLMNKFKDHDSLTEA